MADYTPTQGRYLAFIHAYTAVHGFPPAESEIATALCVSAPAVNTMVKMLEKRSLILRRPGQPRSIQILIADDEIPRWENTLAKGRRNPIASRTTAVKIAHPPAEGTTNLYVLFVFLTGGRMDEKFGNKEISRTIEIRGDQTLEDLHRAIFEAYDRWDEHLYQFQLGKRPFDRNGPNYGVPNTLDESEQGDARVTTLNDLDLKVRRVFGYWFDFGDDWMHQIQVERIERAIPTVPYPRVIKRIGKSPPQYPEED